jgi:hypothetical protein
MIAEVNRESAAVDLVAYRLTSSALADALIAKAQSGVRVRVIVEPTQYRNGSFPEYWLVGAMVDRLWAAGVPIRQRAHAGLTHMKALVTSAVAMHGSSNFTRRWQRDHNYFIPAATKPALHRELADRVGGMWNDGTGFTAFRPQPPATPAVASPASGAANVPRTQQLSWKRTAWAVAFDVYLGTDPTTLSFVGRVNAVLNEDPPAAYGWQPAAPLLPFTRYYWQVVARTFASDRDGTLVKASPVFSFTTSDAAGPAAPAPTPTPPPAPPTPSSCTTVQPAPTWVCVNGGWVPPDSPLAGSPPPAPAPSPGPAPAPPPAAGCVTIRPGPDWVCVAGGWVPPGSPQAVGSSPAPPPAPAPSGSTCVGLPDPFTAIGGGVCTAGGWVPRNHPLAGGR